MSGLRPYRGLARYRHEHARLFAGRKTEVTNCIKKLQGSDALFILHGNSGCGKSSFLEAGVIPRLFDDRAQRKTILYPLDVSPNSDKSSYVVRIGRHPMKQIGSALLRVHQQEGTRCMRVNSETDYRRFDSDNVFDLLADLSLNLPNDHKPLLVIDQSESVFNEEDKDEEEMSEYFDFLGQVSCAGLVAKVLVSLRTDFKGRFDDHLLESKADYTQINTYFLDEIKASGILAAIIHPSKLPECDVTYDRRVPKMIADDLELIRGKWPVLPVLQVICDRLATHARLAHRTCIKERDYRVTGASSAQIASHVEESIVNFFVDRKLSGEVDVVEQADLWQSVLSELVEVDVDGRTRARLSVTNDEIIGFATQKGCERKHIEDVLGWLSEESQYVLERVQDDDRSGELSCSWKLMHDSVAVALRPWRVQGVALTNRVTSATHRPGADDLTIVDLYGDQPPETTKFTTINDLIWDHLIPLYAARRGFDERVGLSFKVVPTFDLTTYKTETNYYARLFKQAKRVRNRLLAVLPGSVFPQILESPWTTVGIPNIYRGYAVVGRKRNGLKPLRYEFMGKRPSESELDERLQCLAEVLGDPSTRIQSYESEGAQFVNCILRLAGHTEPKVIVVATSEYSARFQGTQDPMFTALLDEKFHFVLGPAPSRALSEQAGFEVYADFDDIYALASRSDTDGTYSRERSALDSLLLHENWVVNLPANPSDPVLMRMAAVLFYTVASIREDTDSFVRFLSNYVYSSREKGAYPLQREFIKRAVESCYEYVPPNEHPFTYFGPSSRYRLPKRPNYAPNTVYAAWSKYRTDCDRLLMKMTNQWRGDWPEAARSDFRKAEYQCAIFNYYDALQFLAKTESALQNDADARHPGV